MQIQAFPIEHKIESGTLSYDTSIMISYKESGLTCLMLSNAGGGAKKSEQVKTPRGGGRERIAYLFLRFLFFLCPPFHPSLHKLNAVMTG